MTEMSRWPNCLRKKMTDMSQRNKLCFEADLHFFSVNFGESTIGKVKKLQTYLRQTVQQCWQIFSDLYFCRIRSSFSCSQARNTRSGNNFFSRPRLSSHHLWEAKQRKWRCFRFVARFCELKSLSSSLGRSRLPWKCCLLHESFLPRYFTQVAHRLPRHILLRSLPR